VLLDWSLNDCWVTKVGKEKRKMAIIYNVNDVVSINLSHEVGYFTYTEGFDSEGDWFQDIVLNSSGVDVFNYEYISSDYANSVLANDSSLHAQLLVNAGGGSEVSWFERDIDTVRDASGQWVNDIVWGQDYLFDAVGGYYRLSWDEQESITAADGRTSTGINESYSGWVYSNPDNSPAYHDELDDEFYEYHLDPMLENIFSTGPITYSYTDLWGNTKSQTHGFDSTLGSEYHDFEITTTGGDVFSSHYLDNDNESQNYESQTVTIDLAEIAGTADYTREFFSGDDANGNWYTTETITDPDGDSYGIFQGYNDQWDWEQSFSVDGTKYSTSYGYDASGYGISIDQITTASGVSHQFIGGYDDLGQWQQTYTIYGEEQADTYAFWTVQGDLLDDYLAGYKNFKSVVGGFFGETAVPPLPGNTAPTDIVLDSLSVNEIEGGGGNDVLTGTQEADDIYGYQGNDDLDGQAGNDFLLGGEGNDILTGGLGYDWLWGGAGDDHYVVTDQWDAIWDDSGTDSLHIEADFYKTPTTVETITYGEGIKPIPYWIDSLLDEDASTYRYHYLNNDKNFYYHFPTVAPTYLTDPEDLASWQPVNTSIQLAFAEIFSELGSVLDINFTETDNPYQENTIAIAVNQQLYSAAYTYSPEYFPDYEDYLSSDIFIDNDFINPDLANPNYELDTLVHELGHALGLKHPHGGQYDSSIPPFLSVEEDTGQWTKMTYTDNPDYYSSVFSPFDIATLQYIYDTPEDLTGSDDVFHFSANEGQLVYDLGGDDTISAESSLAAATIFLTPGDWSYVGTKTDLISAGNQLTINFGSEIENAHGSGFDDDLYGNELDNSLKGKSGSDTLYGYSGNDSLWGGLGDDWLFGGDGEDTAVFTGSTGDYELVVLYEGGVRSGYQVKTRASSGVNDGTDFLDMDVELIRFSDQTLSTANLNNSPSEITLVDFMGREIERAEVIETDADGYSVTTIIHTDVLTGEFVSRATVSGADAEGNNWNRETTTNASGEVTTHESTSGTDADGNYWNRETTTNAAGEVTTREGTSGTDAEGNYWNRETTTNAAGEVTTREGTSGTDAEGNNWNRETTTNAAGEVTTREGTSGTDALDNWFNTEIKTAVDGTVTITTTGQDVLSFNNSQIGQIEVEDAAGVVLSTSVITSYWDDVLSQEISEEVLTDSLTGEVTIYERSIDYGMSLVDEGMIRTVVETRASGEVLTYTEVRSNYDGEWVLQGDVPDVPVSAVVSLDTNHIDENVTGAVVGSLSTTDSDTEDTEDTHTYALSGTDAILFEIVEGQLKLKEGLRADYETDPSYELTVTATDSNGLAYTQNLVVEVSDVEEPITNLDDEILGSSSDDILQGGAGRDTVYSGLGNDTIYITNKNGGFSDYINGGLGEDQLVIHYEGITSLADFNITLDRQTDVFTLTDSVGSQIQFTDIETITVGGHDYQFKIKEPIMAGTANLLQYPSSGSVAIDPRDFELRGSLYAHVWDMSGTSSHLHNVFYSESAQDYVLVDDGTFSILKLHGYGLPSPSNGIVGLVSTSASDSFESTWVKGSGGSDFIYGNLGSTTVESGAGDDFIRPLSYEFIYESGLAVSLFSFSTFDDNFPGFYGLHHAPLATAANDSVNGTADTTTVFNAQPDIVDAGEGNDTIFLELAGLTSGSTIDGGEGIDTLQFLNSNFFPSHFYSTFQFPNFEIPEYLTLTTGNAVNFENLIGTKYDDHIIGDEGANELRGGAGSDQVEGGAGDDVLYGDIAKQVIDYDGLTATGELGTTLHHDSYGRHTYWPEQEPYGDILTDANSYNGGGAITAGPGLTTAAIYSYPPYHHAGNDQLLGGAGDDTLFGGAGEDILTGGLGQDSLHGGADTDIFVFAKGDGGSTVDQADKILDFEDNKDLIRLDAAIQNITLTSSADLYAGHTLVQDSDTGEYLAVIKNVLAPKLNKFDFVDGNNLTITTAHNNNTPIVSTSISDQTFIPSITLPEYTYNASTAFSDPDDDQLTYSANVINGVTKNTLPTWLSIDPQTGVLSGTSHIADADSLTIEVTATDDGGLSVSDQFSLDISVPVAGIGTPFTFRSEVVKASNSSLSSDYGLDANEDLIKLTLSVDMAGISQSALSHFESISSTQLNLNINWGDFEALDHTTGNKYQFDPIEDTTNPLLQSPATNDGGGFDQIIIISTSDALSIVDNLTETAGIGSQRDLSTIYLNPVETLEETSLSFSGLVLGNQANTEMIQASSSVTLNSRMDALIKTANSDLLDGLTLNFWKDGYDLNQSVTVDAGKIEVGQLIDDFNAIKLSEADAYQGKLDIRDVMGQLKHIVQLKELTGMSLHAADTNNDDKINILDVMDVLNDIVQIEALNTFDLIDSDGDRVKRIDNSTSSVPPEWTLVANGDVVQSESAYFAADYTIAQTGTTDVVVEPPIV